MADDVATIAELRAKLAEEEKKLLAAEERQRAAEEKQRVAEETLDVATRRPTLSTWIYTRASAHLTFDSIQTAEGTQEAASPTREIGSRQRLYHIGLSLTTCRSTRTSSCAMCSRLSDSFQMRRTSKVLVEPSRTS
jgi:hypothetical protein